MSSLLAHDQRIAASCDYVVGIDEAGRGALAGPVVAAAMLVRRSFFECSWCLEHAGEINDSKLLKASVREANFIQIQELANNGECFFGVGQGSVAEILQHNILGATRLAMQRAVEAAAQCAGVILPSRSSDEPDLFTSTAQPMQTQAIVKVLVDGRPLKPFPYKHEGIVGGDGKSLLIAMASNIAKVSRDRLLIVMDGVHPAYGFAVHKGYATPLHLSALADHGPCLAHRTHFLRKFTERLKNREKF